MQKITAFKDMYLAELQELRSAETQLAEELQRVAEIAAHPEFKDILLHHSKETRLQKQRLDTLLRQHGADPQAHTDQSMEALVRETEKIIGVVGGDDLRDAALIASAQKIAHYEVAAFGTAAALAGQLDFRDDQKILHACVDQERRADNELSAIAKHEVNQDALAASG